MNNEQLVRKVGSPILTPIAILAVCGYLAIIISPFIWIWHGWDLAWKIGLTGIFGAIIFTIISKVLKKVATELVDENIQAMKVGKHKSKFQERLERIAKERGYEFPKSENHETH